MSTPANYTESLAALQIAQEAENAAIAAHEKSHPDFEKALSAAIVEDPVSKKSLEGVSNAGWMRTITEAKRKAATQVREKAENDSLDVAIATAEILFTAIKEIHTKFAENLRSNLGDIHNGNGPAIRATEELIRHHDFTKEATGHMKILSSIAKIRQEPRVDLGKDFSTFLQKAQAFIEANSNK